MFSTTWYIRARQAQGITQPSAIVGPFALGLAIALAAGGCDNRLGNPRCNGSSGACQADGGSSTKTRDGAQDGSASSPVHISPVAVLLTSVDGAEVSQAFEVEVDGVKQSGASWSLDHARAGAIDSDGVFIAHGRSGGQVTVRATVTVDGRLETVSAVLTIKVEKTWLGSGVSEADIASFPEPVVGDPEQAANILYPLEGALMPANVLPPVIQWRPVGHTDDLVRVRLEKTNVSVTAFLKVPRDFTHSFTPNAELWQALADSDRDADIVVSVDRLHLRTGETIQGAQQRRFRLARGTLYGAVYYEHRAGQSGLPRVHRISPGSGTSEVVIPNPPVVGGERCTACHAVSRDGRYMWVGVGDGISTTYDLTTELRGSSPTSRYPLSDANHWIATFSANGQWVITTTDSNRGAFNLIDAVTGVTRDVDGLPTESASYPSWSPDGTAVAYVGNIGLAPDGDPQAGSPIAGDLFVLPVTDESTPTFGTPSMLHVASTLAGEPEGGNCNTHPTWSPDSRFVAFQHGQGANTNQVRNRGALYLVSRDGQHTWRLNRAIGDAAMNGYWPTFSPYISMEPSGKELYWMAFYTRRDYGNGDVGTAGTDRRQLWVTAIDANPSEGEDPSHVPFWLPGQDPTTSNFSAFWAAEACRQTGSSCSTGAECCSELCSPGEGGGETVCTAPPNTACREIGETCGGEGECCGSVECSGNVCYGGQVI